MIAYKMYENNIISSICEYVMHLFRQSKILFNMSLKMCILQCPYSIHIHNKISCACHIPCIPNLFLNTEQRLLFKMVANMNGFVNRLLKNWAMLRTFQMQFVLCISLCILDITFAICNKRI